LEKLRGKALSLKTDELVTKAGFALIIMLALFVFYADFERIGLVEGPKSSEADQTAAAAPDSEGSGKASEASSAQIIRVHISPEKIQRALKAAGVYTGSIDGRIGSGTKAAIVEFQKSHGLKADGVLGKKTWDELKTYLK